MQPADKRVESAGPVDHPTWREVVLRGYSGIRVPAIPSSVHPVVPGRSHRRLPETRRLERVFAEV
jgi:hypothetical protein